MKLSDKLRWTANSYPESTDFDRYLLNHINSPKNSPNYKPSNIKDDTFISELTKIVNSDNNLILSDETIDKIWFLCTAYNIDPIVEGFEDEPAFIVSEIILRNEHLKNMQNNPKEISWDRDDLFVSQVGFDFGADPNADTLTVSMRGNK